MPLDVDIFGQGIYSPRQAARLIGSSPQDILRWTRGSGPTAALWKGHYQALDDAREISFSDLIEVRLVRAFRKLGVSLQAIRFAIKFAQEQFGADHPLSTLGFKTDGQEVLIHALEHDGQMISLSKKHAGQKVFTKIVEQSLSDLEYEDDRVSAWRPKFAEHVVIDPNRSFGSPIVDEFGLSTKMIFDESQAGFNASYLSRIYEVPKNLIADAISYERKLTSLQTASHGQSLI